MHCNYHYIKYFLWYTTFEVVTAKSSHSYSLKMDEDISVLRKVAYTVSHCTR